MISDSMTKALNEQMNFEFYSANIYLSLSAYCNFKGLDGFANWFYNQYQEEMIHAMKFYHYILDQSQPVELDQCPKPENDFGTPLEMFQTTLGHEQEVTKRIYSLVDLALDERDHGTNSFLQWFVTEQVEEEATVNSIIDKLKLVEGTGNGIFMLNNELGQRQAPAATV
ncbi:ferritin [Desulfuromonas acetoxidans]|uniref:Ferritin n=1 Tax=Desulfuromonas acetoxidans (strain DSM 684 / 11070) TaxID=281689 RepID=Q1JW00_DESA6|nr:ferritin [Desulfuromonas acetoxidans]EAT14405.1 Ferritin and Dps [Desulfuromonas acetoxidans DSM 684]MBF0646561.1 ferritin [Desulfuromonas acetoxidans]NVD25694.1 ferritin [Desulfuromonas acetoxidans]NVE16990.1 ferritin [Desulfuromonas acetoxidans]